LNGDARGLPVDQLKRLLLRLTALDNAAKLEEMNVPGWYFHSLAGDMKGRYSVRVTGNWRLTFGWDTNGPNAVDVDYEDYH
jgi:proteic killer suppression protein